VKINYFVKKIHEYFKSNTPAGIQYYNASVFLCEAVEAVESANILTAWRTVMKIFVFSV
jgi:hypothetical protein